VVLLTSIARLSGVVADVLEVQLDQLTVIEVGAVPTRVYASALLAEIDLATTKLGFVRKRSGLQSLVFEGFLDLLDQPVGHEAFAC
jgi:hypothetical protein